jgi:hypothetical protein
MLRTLHFEGDQIPLRPILAPAANLLGLFSSNDGAPLPAAMVRRGIGRALCYRLAIEFPLNGEADASLFDRRTHYY